MDEYDLAAIGGGPGGYVGAIRAAQLGLRVVLFEKDRVGGLCLNWGCIPSKAILKNADVANYVRSAADWGIDVAGASYRFEAAIDRSREVVQRIVGGVETLLNENGITVVRAPAALGDTGTIMAGGASYRARNTLIATGASPNGITGVEIDGKVIITSRHALERRDAPQRALIIGGGPVGVEFAYAWSSYGAKVQIVEQLPTLLPREDPDIGTALARSFTRRGIVSLTDTTVDGVDVHSMSATIRLMTPDGPARFEADTVLVAAGFAPHTDGLSLENAGVQTDERGFIMIGDDLQTNVPGVYAVGDVTGKLMLAHTASHQGVVVAERIAGLNPPSVDYMQIPRAVFCQPQVATIGYTEQEAVEAGFAVKSGRFPLVALGQAIAVAETEGFVKVVADAGTAQVLGIHMIGHDVNQLLGEAALTMLLEATTHELGYAVAAHPTLAEGLKEAALAVDGAAIHVAHRRRLAAKGTDRHPNSTKPELG